MPVVSKCEERLRTGVIMWPAYSEEKYRKSGIAYPALFSFGSRKVNFVDKNSDLKEDLNVLCLKFENMDVVKHFLDISDNQTGNQNHVLEKIENNKLLNSITFIVL